MKQKVDKGFRIKYKFKDDYNPLHINGMYGGFSLNGDEFIIHFYHERWPIPNSHKLDENGKEEKDKIEPPDFDNIIIRMVQSGVVMNRATAKSLRNWLDAFLKDSEDNTKAIEDDKK